MGQDDPQPVDDAQVRALAAQAALPLGEDRVAAVRDLLAAWLPAANELSRAMSDPRLRALPPVTAFTHPATVLSEQRRG